MSVMSASPIFRTQAQRPKTTTWPLGCPAWGSISKIVAGLVGGLEVCLANNCGRLGYLTWLVGGLEHFWLWFFLILGIIWNNNPNWQMGIMIPTDFHIFQRDRYTTNPAISSMFNPNQFHPKMMLWSLIEHGRNKTTQSKVTIQHYQNIRIKISIMIKHHDKLKHYHAHLASHAQLQGQACAIAVCDWPGLWSTNRQWGRWFKLLHLHLYSIYIYVYIIWLFLMFFCQA